MDEEAIAQLQERFDESGFSRLMRLQIQAAGEGFSRCTVSLEEQHLNPEGWLHGGVSYSLADASGVVALFATVPEEISFSTIEGKINYLTTVRPGEVGFIEAKAHLKHRGRRTAVAAVDITDDRDRDVATGLFTYLLVESE